MRRRGRGSYADMDASIISSGIGYAAAENSRVIKELSPARPGRSGDEADFSTLIKTSE